MKKKKYHGFITCGYCGQKIMWFIFLPEKCPHCKAHMY